MKDYLQILLENETLSLEELAAEMQADMEIEKASAKEYTILIGENFSESHDTLEKALGKAQMTAAFNYDRIITLKQGDKVIHRFWQGEWKKF